jgi:hypothetical protein
MQGEDCSRPLVTHNVKTMSSVPGVLSTAFDPVDGEWIWYAKAWARGVAVSPAERELYLDFHPIEFRRLIAGRAATHPRRPYWPTLARILAAMVTGRDPKAFK